MNQIQGDNRPARYLLGRLSEPEREQLEAEYFEDDEVFEQILIAEAELADAYVRAELSAEERARFEKCYLASPRRCERVQFARALAGAISDARRTEPTPEVKETLGRQLFAAVRARSMAWRYAFAAAALVAAVSFTWLLVERAELRQLRAERAALAERTQELERRLSAEQARSAEMPAQLEAGRAGPTPAAGPQRAETDAQQHPLPSKRLQRGRVKKDDAEIARRSPEQERGAAVTNRAAALLNSTAETRRIDQLPPQERTRAELSGSVSFDLMPGLVRGGGANKLAVPGKATFILLQLNLEADATHENYRAVIETADGHTVWHEDAVKPHSRPGGAIELPAVPARDLPPGDYVLILSGQQPDGSLADVADYSFRIVRK